MSLEELQSSAERHQESIRIKSLELSQASLAVASASAARLPKLDLSASYNHISKTASMDLNIPGLPFSKSIKIGDGNVYESALTLTVPLFTGFRLSTAYDLQLNQELTARQTLEGGIIEIRNAINAQYRTAQLARKSMLILDQQSSFVSALLASRIALLRQGQALAYDTLQLSTRLQSIAVDRATAENQYNRCILLLMQLAAIDHTFDVGADIPAKSRFDDASMEVLVNIASESRYEMKNLATARDAAELGIRAARSSYYPSVVGVALLRYARPGVDQFHNEWMDYYTAGVRLDWNIWSWFGDKRTTEKQELEREKTDLRKEQLLRQIRTQAGLVRDDLDLKKRTIILLENQIVLERTRTELTNARMREGLATVTDMVDAETSLTTALLRLEQVRLEYAAKLAELYSVLGIDRE
jgi:outer membrane protein TolC